MASAVERVAASLSEHCGPLPEAQGWTDGQGGVSLMASSAQGEVALVRDDYVVFCSTESPEEVLGCFTGLREALGDGDGVHSLRRIQYNLSGDLLLLVGARNVVVLHSPSAGRRGVFRGADGPSFLTDLQSDEEDDVAEDADPRVGDRVVHRAGPGGSARRGVVVEAEEDCCLVRLRDGGEILSSKDFLRVLRGRPGRRRLRFECYEALAGLRSVVDAQWHPLSGSHVGVLARDASGALSLHLADVGSRESARAPEHSVPLGPDVRAFAFCSPAFGWGALGVWLLDGAGGLSALCPLAPDGLRVPAALVERLRADAERAARDSAVAGGAPAEEQRLSWISRHLEVRDGFGVYRRGVGSPPVPPQPVALQGLPAGFLDVLPGADGSCLQICDTGALAANMGSPSAAHAPVLAVLCGDGAAAALHLGVAASEVQPVWTQDPLAQGPALSLVACLRLPPSLCAGGPPSLQGDPADGDALLLRGGGRACT